MASKIIVDQLQTTSLALNALTLPASNATTGQYLQDNGSGTLSWSTVAGATPKIGQVLQAQKTDVFTSASASWIDITDLTITITPTLATSKILVISNVIGLVTYAAAHLGLRLLRDTTDIALGDTAGSRTRESGGIYLADAGGAFGTIATTWLDEPASASALVYKMQGWAESTNTFYINRSQTDTDSAGYGRTVSTITVMEYLV